MQSRFACSRELAMRPKSLIKYSTEVRAQTAGSTVRKPQILAPMQRSTSMQQKLVEFSTSCKNAEVKAKSAMQWF